MTTDRERLPEEEQALMAPGTEPSVDEDRIEDRPPSPEEQAIIDPDPDPDPDRDPDPDPDRGPDGGGWDDRWSAIQVRFVDDPQRSVAQADELVTDLLDEVTSVLQRERAQVEDRWNADVEPSTEDLRQTLQDYRTFFERLRAL